MVHSTSRLSPMDGCPTAMVLQSLLQAMVLQSRLRLHPTSAATDLWPLPDCVLSAPSVTGQASRCGAAAVEKQHLKRGIFKVMSAFEFGINFKNRTE